MGKQWKQCQTLFFWVPKSLQMVTAAMKLKDAYSLEGFPGSSDGKASAYNERDPGSIPGWERSPGEGNGNQLQYSCLDNSTQKSLAGYSPWGRKESDTTKQLSLIHTICQYLNQIMMFSKALRLLKVPAHISALTVFILSFHSPMTDFDFMFNV